MQAGAGIGFREPEGGGDSVPGLVVRAGVAGGGAGGLGHGVLESGDGSECSQGGLGSQGVQAGPELREEGGDVFGDGDGAL